MLKELTDYQAQNAKEAQRADQLLNRCQLIKELIEDSEGKKWVKISEVGQERIACICRNRNYYFAAENTPSLGWRTFNPEDEYIFSFLSVEVLI